MKMAIIATRGSHTALVNLCTTIMAAALSEMRVRVFLRDEALYRMDRKRIKEVILPDTFGQDGEKIRKKLAEMKLLDLTTLLESAKAQGDVRIFACSSSMGIFGMKEEDLSEGVDEVCGMTSFLLDEVLEAQTVLSF